MIMKQNENGQKQLKQKRPLSPAMARKETWKEQIITLYLQGNSMEMVREKMKGVSGGHSFSITTVHKYIHEAIDQWKSNKDQLITEHKSIELEKINRLEIAYWEGYTRSLLGAKTVKTRKTPLEDGKNAIVPPAGDKKSRKNGKNAVESRFNTVEVMDEARETFGDVRYLNGIQWCVEYRCKLLGIEAPVKIEQNTTLNANVNQTTTIVRTVTFKTRQTTATPQIFDTPQNNN